MTRDKMRKVAPAHRTGQLGSATQRRVAGARTNKGHDPIIARSAQLREHA